MKSLILTIAAAFCFIASASAQNEVPGQPNTRNATADENIHAPARMDRQSGTETQQEQYNATDPQHKPEPGTMINTENGGQNATQEQKAPTRQMNNSGTKPKTGTHSHKKEAGK